MTRSQASDSASGTAPVGFPVLGIITSPALANTHGTGVQILRLLEEPVPFFHLYWSTSAGRSESEASHLLADREIWRWARGRRFFHRLKQTLQWSWWLGNEINPKKFERLRTQQNLRCDAAYVVIDSEEGAARALSLLSYLRCPYVVHLMDLCHGEGLSPEHMAGYRKLLGGATVVLALNEAIRREVEKFETGRVEVVAFGRDPAPRTAHAPGPDAEVRLVMMGSIGHPGGLRLLEQAWPGLSERCRRLKLVYFGPERMLEALPRTLRPVVEYRGYLSTEASEETLATSHIGFLPGPDRLDCYGRFSVPSRVSDFFMLGLPLIAYTERGTATERFLAPLEGSCVRLVREPTALIDAVLAWVDDTDRWRAASASARSFAIENLAMGQIRNRVYAHLLTAAQAGQGMAP